MFTKIVIISGDDIVRDKYGCIVVQKCTWYINIYMYIIVETIRVNV
jgi:hypothetical protein